VRTLEENQGVAVMAKKSTFLPNLIKFAVLLAVAAVIAKKAQQSRAATA
jgi:hypothetical protein